jgi:hypothetical protein
MIIENVVILNSRKCAYNSVMVVIMSGIKVQ